MLTNSGVVLTNDGSLMIHASWNSALIYYYRYVLTTYTHSHTKVHPSLFVLALC